MTRKDLREIAKLVAKEKNVDRKLLKVLFSKLSRTDLLYLARYLRGLLLERQVQVLSFEDIPKPLKKDILKKFPDKNVVFLRDPTMGDGTRIIINDTILDFSIESYLNEAFKNLRNSL